MSLSISQVQNVVRTYQNQVREGKIKSILGIRDEASGWRDQVDISSEGKRLLERESGQSREQKAGGSITDTVE